MTWLRGLALAAAVAGCAVCAASLADPPATTAVTSTGTLKVGDPAPDFTLPDQKGEDVTLSSFRGKKNVVLAVYVLAFTGG